MVPCVIRPEKSRPGTVPDRGIVQRRVPCRPHMENPEIAHRQKIPLEHAAVSRDSAGGAGKTVVPVRGKNEISYTLRVGFQQTRHC